MRRTLAAALLLVAAPALAATFVATSVEEVARTSDAVVRGRVVRRESRATADARIVTEAEIAVESAWKGAPGKTVRVVVPGGSLGTIAMRVDAAPTFADGEEVVLFLVREGRAWRVNGWALGKYRVEGDEARPGLEAAAILPRALAAGERAVGPMKAAELEKRVRVAR